MHNRIPHILNLLPQATSSIAAGKIVSSRDLFFNYAPTTSAR